MNNDEMFEKTRKKVSFLYSIKDRTYVIGHGKVLDAANAKIVYPDYKRYYNKYEEIVANFNNGKEINKIQTDEIMNTIIGCASTELTSEENRRNTISIKDFWNDLNNEEKEIVYNQIIDFENMFRYIGIDKLHPNIGKY